MKVRWPQRVFMLRGNPERRQITQARPVCAPPAPPAPGAPGHTPGLARALRRRAGRRTQTHTSTHARTRSA
jgi:hypothetical protein